MRPYPKLHSSKTPAWAKDLQNQRYRGATAIYRFHCKKHGTYTQRGYTHFKMGCGCPKCDNARKPKYLPLHRPIPGKDWIPVKNLRSTRQGAWQLCRCRCGFLRAMRTSQLRCLTYSSKRCRQCSYSKTGFINKDGYRVIRVSGKARGEHRVVMEKILGRPLLPTETVHHINGHRADNRPKNLELWQQWHPRGQRQKDALRVAIDLCRQNGYTVTKGEKS